jgi:hypothetical protein
MKKIILLAFFCVCTIHLISQNQTINGVLTMKDDIIMRSDTDTTRFGEWGKRIYFGNKNLDNGDIIYTGRFNREANKSDFRIGIGDDNNGDDRFVIGNIYWNSGREWGDWFVVTNQKRVGIGVSYPTCALDVNGTIRSKEVKIEATGWADFVFDKDYKLPSLSEVEMHINEKGTLPDIPSEKEVAEKGIDVGEMQAKLLQKIEELTLYVIELKKENEAQDKLIQELQNK